MLRVDDFNSLAALHFKDFVRRACTPVHKRDFVERVEQKENAEGKEKKHEEPSETASVPSSLHENNSIVFHCTRLRPHAATTDIVVLKIYSNPNWVLMGLGGGRRAK